MGTLTILSIVFGTAATLCGSLAAEQKNSQNQNQGSNK